MAPPGNPPRRKNPVLRTPLPTVPPAARSRVALRLTAAAAEGRFELQVCRDCGAVQYPPREACCACLSVQLDWRAADGAGELIAETTLAHSNELYFRERLPWRVGLVRLDCGPTLIVHVHADCPSAPTRVRVRACLDKAGLAALLALPINETPTMTEDRILREMICDPRFRKILVTDGNSAVGQELVRALIAAGADLVWVGHAAPGSRAPGLMALTELSQVRLVPLDFTDSRSVQDLAAEIGGRVDILVSNAEHHRPAGIAARKGVETARAEMDVNYFGLLRLAQAFAPIMRARGADAPTSATAWVNLLSIFALANLPSHGTFAASKAAAFSLSQCLRAEMQPAGIRVINVFPGPIDEEWNQLVPPPKLAPAALARAIVDALRDGIEDVYPGEVARDLLERWRESPKALERELADR